MAKAKQGLYAVEMHVVPCPGNGMPVQTVTVVAPDGEEAVVRVRRHIFGQFEEALMKEPPKVTLCSLRFLHPVDILS